MHLIKYNSYSKAIDLSREFLEYTKIESMFESDSETPKKILSELIDKYKLNLSIVLSFGAGMELMIPIVKKLCENGEFNIDLNTENVVLMTITAITIVYLEEAKEEKIRKELENSKQIKKEEKIIQILENDSRSLLEELKLRGIGNGIIKKLIVCIKAIGKLVKTMFKHNKTVIDSFFDMFGYAAICVPILSSLKLLIGNYSWTLDNFYHNLESILIGLGSISVKYITDWFLSISNKKKIPVEIRNSGYIDTKYDAEKKEKLIKEQ